MRKVANTDDFNAQELLLLGELAHYEQTVLSAGNAYQQRIESELRYIQKKRELSAPFLQPEDEIRQKSHSLKVSVCLVFELLRLVGKGRDVNDLTTLSGFASIITGYSKDNILNTSQKGINFSKQHHGRAIQEANEVLQRLDLPFALDIAMMY